jgi:menaquinone-dependent protoporphyrinogen oxidase
MKTAIIYASKHGTTAFVAGEIKKSLVNDEVVLFNLNDQNRVELRRFDRIILGSSVYAGSVLPKVRKFIEQNMVELLQKELSIFVCCMFFAKAQEQIEKGFPQALIQHALSVKHLGGEFRFEEMNFIERFLVKKIAGASASISKINYKNIELFIEEITQK